MKSIARAASVIIAFFVPVLAFAQTGYTVGVVSTSGGFFGFGGGVCAGGTIVCTAQTILYLINYVLVPVLFAIAFIVFLYGIAKAYIFSVGDEEAVKKGHSLIFWGIIGFVVMISVWGLVNVVANTFGLTGSYAPSQPYSPYTTSGNAMYGQQPQSTQYIECPKDSSGNCL